MTTLTYSQTSGTQDKVQGFGTRILNVIKLQFVDRQWLLITPLIMILSSLVITFIVATLIYIGTDGFANYPVGTPINIEMQYSWAVLVPIWYLPVASIMAFNPMIHLAFGLSSSRKEFYLGTVASFALAAIFHATVLTLIWFVEKATDGFGLHVYFADSSIYSGQEWYNVFLISMLLNFSMMAICSFAAILYLRWRTFGVLGFFAVLILALLATATIVTLGGHWEVVLGWVAQQVTQLFLWIGIAAAAALGIAYLLVRKVTAQN